MPCLFIWLRCLRALRILFITLPIVLSGFASWKLLATSERQGIKFLAAVCALLAGLLPAVYAALKFDDHLEYCKQLAGEFKNLQDRFRQAALVYSLKPFDEFEAEFKQLRQRLEAAKSQSYTAPRWCFKKAQKEIATGVYKFDDDDTAKLGK